MTNRPDLVASRYDGVSVGNSLLYSFEEQDAVPIDGSNGLARELSPFTLRLVLPENLSGNEIRSGTNSVNFYSNANKEINNLNSGANALQRQYGITSVTSPLPGSSIRSVPSSIEQLYHLGEGIIEANGISRNRAVLSDRLTAADIRYQVERVLAAPPLTLLINPNNMVTNYASVQDFSNRTRDRFIFKRWGEEQIKISFSGSTGAFITGENPQRALSNAKETSTPTGVQFASRRNSAAYQNFLALYHFYRNNGYLYDTLGRTNANLAVGAVAIDYDQFTYVGHIENFSYDFKSETQHKMNWELEFIVSKMYDRSSQAGLIGPMRGPYANPLTGGATLTPTVSDSTTASSQSFTTYSKTPFELLGKK